MFIFAILGFPLIMAASTDTDDADYTAKESKAYDGRHGIKGFSAYSREKRAIVASLKTLKAIGRKAVRILENDAVPVRKSSNTFTKVYKKQGSITRAEKDFSDINPNIKRKGTYFNGMEYQLGEVGDQIVTFEKDPSSGKATIEAIRNRLYNSGRKGIKTKIVYTD